MRLLTILLILISVSFGQQQQLQNLVERALENNPALKARGHRVQAAKELIDPAGALPDPMISLGLMNVPSNSFAFDQEPMTGKQLAFTQAIPFPGKLSLKKKLAKIEAQKATDVRGELELQIIRNVKQIYFKIFDLDRAIEVTERNQTVLKNFTQIAQTRYTVGRGIQQDVLKAQVEFARFEDRLISLKEKRAALNAQLNALLNLSQDQALEKTEIWSFEANDIPFDTLKNRLLKNNPILKAWQKNTEQSAVRVRLAKKEFLPDLTFTLAYTQREVLQSGLGGNDFLSAVVGLKIPLYFWKKQDKQLQARRFQKKESTEQFNDIKNRLLASLNDAYQRAQKKAELIQLYQATIIPQASQALNSAIASYQNDQVDFLTLLNNLMVLFNYEREYYRLISEYYQQLAQIEYLTAKQIIK